MDILHLPRGGGQNKVFYATAPAATFAGHWQPWRKPKNCAFVDIFALAGAGSGGGGLTGGTGTARGGGAGGGSSAITRALFPAYLLPDVLFILVGLGGAAPAGNTIGNAGGATYVNIAPIIAAEPKDCLVLTGGGGGGAKGTTGAAAAGAAGAITVIANSCIIGQFAITWSSIAGVTGIAGGNGANGAGGNITPMTTIPLSGGAGGGGVTTDGLAIDGGDILASGRFPLIPGGTGHSTNCVGNAGMTLRGPLSTCGGSGGGCNGDAGVNGGVGGAGGQGGLGSGGGGGGGGITGGPGGPGGNGIVIISWW